MFKHLSLNSKNAHVLPTWGGTGMKNQVAVGYRVFKTIQVQVESGLGQRETLPENTCITS